jgi:hypothetical protein
VLVRATTQKNATVVDATDDVKTAPHLLKRPRPTDASSASPSESQRGGNCHSWSCLEMLWPRRTCTARAPHIEQTDSGAEHISYPGVQSEVSTLS